MNRFGQPVHSRKNKFKPILFFTLFAFMLIGHSAVAYQGFDIQPFRPDAGARGLVIMPISEPMKAWSFDVGGYLGISIDPLILRNITTNKAITNIVTARLETYLYAGVGIANWAELSAVLPLVVFQTGDNLNTIGREGPISSTVLSDLSLIAKVAIPGVRRKNSYDEGFGLAGKIRVDFPTGSVVNFAGNGTVVPWFTMIGDYRFKGGYLVGLEAGMQVLTPTRVLSNLALGPTFVATAAAEVPVWRSHGLNLIAGVNISVPTVKISTLPETARQIPAQAVMGIRGYNWAKSGVIWTTGLSFGCDCGYSIPSFMYWLDIKWLPQKTQEYVAVKDYKEPPPPVPKSVCPEQYGEPIPANLVCPPKLNTKTGKIVVLQNILFATDSAILASEGQQVLTQVAATIKEEQKDRLKDDNIKIVIEGHTDSNASYMHNIQLSIDRANSVMTYLITQGVPADKLLALGFGKSRPFKLEDGLVGNALLEAQALNRRVEFTVVGASWSQNTQAQLSAEAETARKHAKTQDDLNTPLKNKTRVR